MGRDEVEGLDDEFLFHLNRGSDLLARGDAEAARASLERGLELAPKNAKALGLLGQAYYKLARFDDAARVWHRLVDDNPVEAGARVNLGLACLKAKRYADAVKQLEIALDLVPEHKKAMGYLGLALLESGNLTRAREWFEKAGSDQMVARCDDLIAGREASARGGPAAEPEVETQAAQAAAAQAEEAASPEPIRTPPPGAVAAYRPPDPAGASDALGAWAAARIVEPPRDETFAVADGSLAVTIRGEVRVRLDGLFATRGRVAMVPEMKRFRGRPTESAFGEGATRVHRVSGDGALLYRTGGRRFTPLELAADAAYLREEALFGFEDGVAFENGRVPSSISAELHLVHLRGPGRFLLVTKGEPVSVDVLPGAPLRLPIAALVGWMGALTPRVCALVEEGGPPGVVAVELTGEGRVVADPAAAEG